MYPILLLLVAMLKYDATFISPPLYAGDAVSTSPTSRKGERPSLRRPGVLSIVTSRLKGRVPMPCTSSVDNLRATLYFCL